MLQISACPEHRSHRFFGDDQGPQVVLDVVSVREYFSEPESEAQPETEAQAFADLRPPRLPAIS